MKNAIFWLFGIMFFIVGKNLFAEVTISFNPEPVPNFGEVLVSPAAECTEQTCKEQNIIIQNLLGPDDANIKRIYLTGPDSRHFHVFVCENSPCVTWSDYLKKLNLPGASLQKGASLPSIKIVYQPTKDGKHKAYLAVDAGPEGMYSLKDGLQGVGVNLNPKDVIANAIEKPIKPDLSTMIGSRSKAEVATISNTGTYAQDVKVTFSVTGRPTGAASTEQPFTCKSIKLDGQGNIPTTLDETNSKDCGSTPFSLGTTSGETWKAQLSFTPQAFGSYSGKLVVQPVSGGTTPALSLDVSATGTANPRNVTAAAISTAPVLSAIAGGNTAGKAEVATISNTGTYAQDVKVTFSVTGRPTGAASTEQPFACKSIKLDGQGNIPTTLDETNSKDCDSTPFSLGTTSGETWKAQLSFTPQAFGSYSGKLVVQPVSGGTTPALSLDVSATGTANPRNVTAAAISTAPVLSAIEGGNTAGKAEVATISNTGTYAQDVKVTFSVTGRPTGAASTEQPFACKSIKLDGQGNIPTTLDETNSKDCGSTPFSLGTTSGETWKAQLSFTPQAFGSYSGKLVVQPVSGGTTPALSLDVSATGTANPTNVTAAAISTAPVLSAIAGGNTAGKAEVATISNTGTYAQDVKVTFSVTGRPTGAASTEQPFACKSIKLDGQGNIPTTLDETNSKDCGSTPFSLGTTSGETWKAQLSFTPQAFGSYSGKLVVQPVSGGTTPALSLDVSATGTANPAHVTAAAISSAPVLSAMVGESTSPTAVATIQNNGTYEQNVNVTFPETGFACMAVKRNPDGSAPLPPLNSTNSKDCGTPFSLGIGEIWEVQLTFTAAAVGTSSGSLSVQPVSGTTPPWTHIVSATGKSKPMNVTTNLNSLEFSLSPDKCEKVQEIAISGSSDLPFTISLEGAQALRFNLCAGPKTTCLHRGPWDQELKNMRVGKNPNISVKYTGSNNENVKGGNYIIFTNEDESKYVLSTKVMLSGYGSCTITKIVRAQPRRRFPKLPPWWGLLGVPAGGLFWAINKYLKKRPVLKLPKPGPGPK